jgi:hypothetical protein
VGVNVLGDRKKHQITAVTRMPVLQAWVRSHEMSGRWAFLTIGWTRQVRHHRHAWYDRWTGEWHLDASDPPTHNTSCYRLFPAEMGAEESVAALRALDRALRGRP